MAFDDDDPKPAKPKGLEPRVLDRLSIDELRDYIAELKAEIARLKQAGASAKAPKDEETNF